MCLFGDTRLARCWQWFVVVCCISCAMALSGCNLQLTGPVSPSDPNAPAGPETVWTLMADCIVKGKIKTSTKLVKMVGHLRDLESIDDNDVENFYSAFTDEDGKCPMRSVEIKLTKEHANVIRGLPIPDKTSRVQGRSAPLAGSGGGEE